MSDQVLILHGKDSIFEATTLQKALYAYCFNVTTFKEATKHFPLSTPIITSHENLVENSMAVLVIVSPALFADNFLKNIVENAKISKKFVPILAGFPGDAFPTWIKDYSCINLGNPDSYDRDLNRLVMSLISRSASQPPN